MPVPLTHPILAIIADDLTGALDAAAPFAGRGLSVEVALHPEALPSAVATGAQVISVSTGSRDGSTGQARVAMDKVVAALPAGTRIFKKIDSRLKGHIAAELAALDFARALVAPAIPDFGRYVQDGAVTGFGVEAPLPVAPILGCLAERCLVLDIATEEEMREALAMMAPSDLLVGARGLAEALACQVTDRPLAKAVPPAGPRGLFVVGSRDPITLAQVAALVSATDVLVLRAPNGILDGTPLPQPLPDLVLVQAVAGEVPASGEAVAANLARSIHPALTAACDTLLLTGGATAEAVLLAMGIERMRLLGECLPGLPVAKAGGLTLVAKSGGFGDEDALVQVVRMMEAGPVR